MAQTYRVGQFAQQAGVSVRTLHHYDRIGLLRPSGRSQAGHRLYSEWDLLHLQQVLTLRYLGFSLEQIGHLLRQRDWDWLTSLEKQQTVLHERIIGLNRIQIALDRLLEARRATGAWDWALVAGAASAAAQGLTEKGDVMETSPDMAKRWEELGKQVGDETRLDVERRWADLMAEVKANLGLAPADPKARALADRWNALTEETFSHYKNNGAEDLWQQAGDRYKAGELEDHPHAPGSERFGFIARVNAAR